MKKMLVIIGWFACAVINQGMAQPVTEQFTLSSDIGNPKLKGKFTFEQYTRMYRIFGIFRIYQRISYTGELFFIHWK